MSALPLLLCVLAVGCGRRVVRVDAVSDARGGWITIRGSGTNSGDAATGRVDAERLLWQRKTGGQAAGEPTVGGGLLFFPGNDRRLEVYETATGDRLFRKKFDGPVTGALPGDSVIQFLTDQDEQRLFTYRYGRMGEISNYRVARSGVAPRRLDDTLLLITGLNGHLFCHDATGAVVWTAETPGPIRSTPAVVDSTIYVSSGRRIMALSTADGALRWSHQSSGAVPAAPSVDRHVYFGSADSLVYALDLEAGGMVWFASVGGGVFTTPVLGSGRVYAAANDGLIYALDQTTGKILWTYDTGAVANLAPTLSGDLLYVATRTGKLLALDANNGVVIYDHQLRAGAVTPPIVAEGRVFVADSRRQLYCFGSDNQLSEASE